MRPVEELLRENKGLRERLSRMGRAFQRINDSLDFKSVLQGVLDSARSLTDAKYGMMTLMNEGVRVQNCLSSGLTPSQTRRIWRLPENEALFEYFAFIDEPLRLRDLHSHIRLLNLPVFRPPMPVSRSLTFLVAPIRHRGERVGTFFLAEKEVGRGFTAEDEETLVMFASQAALVISNARRYQDEQRARADLETLIDTSPVGVAVLDAKTGQPVTFNREAARIVEDIRPRDCSPEKLLAMMNVRRADGREVSLDEVTIAQALSTGETVRAEEVVLHVHDGGSVTVLINATPIFADDGQLESFVVTLQDMTQLEVLERMRAEFLAMVSHELRGPLAAIKGSAATALNDTVPFRQAEMVQFLRIIEQQADRLGVMVNDLLDIARIETGTLTVHPVPVVVTDLLDQARNTFLRGRDGRDIHIEMVPGLFPVLADPGRIAQVLVNLLANAAQNSPEAATIRVTAVQEEDNVAICVIDKGKGLTSEEISRLFRKISPSDRDASLGYDSGTGLGLSICKGIVEAHGGRIWCESDGLGTGTRVKFTLPIAEQVASLAGTTPGASPSDTETAAEKQTTILVVDDDPQTLRSVRDALSKAGYIPIVTADPNQAIKLMDEHRPELALLDLVLPGSDGVELMQDIVEKADVPVIFLSAYGHEDAIARAFDNGATDYVVKPFSPTELTARIRATLRKWTPIRKAVPSKPFSLGDLTIDYTRRRVTIAGQPVNLTGIEYRLIEELSLSRGRTESHQDLLKRVWSRRTTADRRPLHTAVKNIRRKLGDDARNPRYIINVPRVGYRIGSVE